jgi:hypothetical protein
MDTAAAQANFQLTENKKLEAFKKYRPGRPLGSPVLSVLALTGSFPFNVKFLISENCFISPNSS